MHVMGCSAGEVGELADAIAAAARRGWPGVLWCDGSDAVAILADEGDTAADIRAAVAKFVPELAS